MCKEFSCVFKCAELEDYVNHDITKSDQYRELIKELMEIKGPVLYWYEIISNHSNDEIINSLQMYEQKQNHRAIPVFFKDTTGTPEFCMWGNARESSGDVSFNI